MRKMSSLIEQMSPLCIRLLTSIVAFRNLKFDDIYSISRCQTFLYVWWTFFSHSLSLSYIALYLWVIINHLF